MYLECVRRSEKIVSGSGQDHMSHFWEGGGGEYLSGYRSTDNLKTQKSLGNQGGQKQQQRGEERRGERVKGWKGQGGGDSAE